MATYNHYVDNNVTIQQIQQYIKYKSNIHKLKHTFAKFKLWLIYTAEMADHALYTSQSCNKLMRQANVFS